MRYSKEHKAETRERIVRAAARLFRERGLDGVGVAELMAQAGLTHGGFYAHFPSKAALIAEAAAVALRETTESLGRAAAQADSGARLDSVADSYLDKRHRDRPGSGCAIAAIGAELAREERATRAAFTREVEGLVATLAGAMPARGGPTRERAIAVLATLVGGMVLARAVSEPALSNEILGAARRQVQANSRRTPRA